MLKISIIGYGAIGSAVHHLLKDEAAILVESVIVPTRSVQVVSRKLATMPSPAQVRSHLGADAGLPDLIVECAGHAAIAQHVIPALKRGVPCLVASVGALAEAGLPERLEAAAQEGNTQVQLLSGAIGGIDALAAGKIGGLNSVVYTGRKAPGAWKGTPADAALDLGAIHEPTVIFDGTAREAARLYPKNANVAATVALAGLGLDRTLVRLWADPTSIDNVHEVSAAGAFGSFDVIMRGKPLEANPKTSALTVYSVVRGIRNRAYALGI